MNTKLSATAWFSAANGKLVRKTVGGALTLEDWESYAAALKSEILAKGLSYTEDDDGAIRCGTYFWRKPKLRKVEEGILTVRSSDYALNGVWGEKKGSTINDEGDLVKLYPNGMTVTLHLIEGE